MNVSRYRADIDGLRAVAVLSVLFYHVGFRSFGGGFIGVDVFFVISGFLITRLICNEVEAGTFSFTDFYARRARRLFPSLFFTLLLCFILAFNLFSPQHFQRFGGALLYSVFSLANFYFWGESGYFDAGAEFKPLLHTWSLSVEEQFYLVWPMILVFLLIRGPKWAAPSIVVICGAISLYLNHLVVNGPPAKFNFYAPLIAEWFKDGRSTIFYLAPFRVFEFAIGAIMVWLVRYQPKNKRILEPCVPIGLAFIAYPILTFSEDTLFPSFNALIPCFGSALLLYAGAAKYSGRLINNPLAIRLGLISYSLYLIHWPIIVFYRYYKFDALTRTEMYGICILSVVVAALMYRFIEQPFRRGIHAEYRWRPRAVGFACALLALLVAIPSAHARINGGWAWRLKPEIRDMLERVDEGKEGYKIGARYDVCHLRINEKRLPPALYSECLSSSVDKPNILLFGDSNAAAYAHGLREVFPDINLLQVTSGWCMPTYPVKKHGQTSIPVCPEIHDAFWATIERGDISTVVISARWTDVAQVDLETGRIDALAEKLQRRGVRLFVLGPIPELTQDNTKLIAKSLNLHELTKTQYLALKDRSFEVDANLFEASLTASWRYYSVIRAFCSDGVKENCDFIIDERYPHSHDYGHLSHWASEHVAAKLQLEQGLSFSE